MIYVSNPQNYPFKFNYNGKQFEVPCSGVHPIPELSEGDCAFGGYLREYTPEEVKDIKLENPIRGTLYETQKQKERRLLQQEGEEPMSLYDDDWEDRENADEEVDIGGDDFHRSVNVMYAAAAPMAGSIGAQNTSGELDFFGYGSKGGKKKSYRKGEGVMPDSSRENDLVLAPREFALICDTNTGNVNVVVGPKKETLTNTDKPMAHDEKRTKFVPCGLRDAIRSFISANEQSYVVLQNPVTKDGELVFPNEGQQNKPEKLEHGRSVNINGPVNFPLWPGQIAEVIPGHQLRSNQYLLVKVTNAEEATKNEATIEAKEGAEAEAKKQQQKSYVTGQLIIIKGTDVSFYIPPTGMEVVPDDDGNFVREALTLERLEYCVLKDENGAKRYERGPAVVFPLPTETFISRSGGSNIFKAVELNENMGLYIKVISDYEEGGKKYDAGDELFISGKETKIYYPRPEHAIIKYGKQIIHYAVAVPKGDARYVLNKRSGDVKMVKGPEMFLPDPRNEVIVKRVIDPRDVELWFPGNQEAIAYNTKLSKELPHADYLPAADMSAKRRKETAGQHSRSTMRFTDDSTLEDFADGVTRMAEYTPPRTITLENKYEGAVLINVWPGYAVQVVTKSGERRVIAGPHAVLLEYDEILEKLMLSTGNPKDDRRLMNTVYLHVSNNKVSDTVSATTKDLVDVEIPVSYRVNFMPEKKDNWFSVQNYTKFLTEHLRSIIRNAVKKVGIEEFNENSIDIVRDTVLGKAAERAQKDGEKKSQASKRTGRIFEENGMHVYNVEVLDIRIDNEEISDLLIENQHKTVSDTIALMQTKKRLTIVTETEKAERQILDEKNVTDVKRLENQTIIEEKKAERDAVAVETHLSCQATLNEIAKHELQRKINEDDRKLKRLKSQTSCFTEAHEKRMAAISPKLVEAINAYGNKQLARELAQALPKASGTQGLLFGTGGMDGLMKMVMGTPIEKTLREVMDKNASQDPNPETTPKYDADSKDD